MQKWFSLVIYGADIAARINQNLSIIKSAFIDCVNECSFSCIVHGVDIATPIYQDFNELKFILM